MELLLPPSSYRSTRMEEGKINDQKKNDPKEESIEVPEIADEQHPLPEIADEQHAIPSPQRIWPPQLTLEDAEKRLKRQSKAVSSTVQKMIKRAKRGVDSFSKNIIEKKAGKNKKKEDEDEDEDDDDEDGDQWEYEYKCTDDDLDDNNSPGNNNSPPVSGDTGEAVIAV
ncbi:uncharacterized protein LOC125868368 [Solanum stenotomum]|uniref:uncharacterized protein LOC125868368 n=1 Tax=Solanum stenotomum TaxID=172797 RepID=UPI0020D05C37|nr:uncharacterized protein LOC125868368 [Solanum stenotomum]